MVEYEENYTSFISNINLESLQGHRWLLQCHRLLYFCTYSSTSALVCGCDAASIALAVHPQESRTFSRRLVVRNDSAVAPGLAVPRTLALALFHTSLYVSLERGGGTCTHKQRSMA